MRWHALNSADNPGGVWIDEQTPSYALVQVDKGSPTGGPTHVGVPIRAPPHPKTGTTSWKYACQWLECAFGNDLLVPAATASVEGHDFPTSV